MPEKLLLTTPALPPPVVEYTLVQVDKNLEQGTIRCVARSNTGVLRVLLERGEVAAGLLNLLNTADNSRQSEVSRVLEYMVGKGFFAGSVTGTPDVVSVNAVETAIP